MKTLAVIPARGGSKGIPRKNLRPLAGKPMIYYSINAAIQAKSVDEVIVTTDDDEIALFAERFGAKIIKRPENLANDSATLDPVIVHAANVAEKEIDLTFDIVVTIQPTSPLVKPHDIDSALSLFTDEKVDTVLSVVDDRHLCWCIENAQAIPMYSERVNRQQLPSNYKETGAIIACRRTQLNSGTRIGKNVSLHVMPQERSFDIDSFADLYLCEAMLTQKRIVFAVIGRPELGMGHAYRVAILAHELVQHELIIVCEEDDLLAYDYLRNLNYQVCKVPNGLILDKILDLKPNLVINDILDTKLEYVKALKSYGIRVVNFEDLGSGSYEADLVVNALYPHQIPSDRHLVGSRYFCLRDEFLHLPENRRSGIVKKVLLTFGGTDENNLTFKALQAILPYCKQNSIHIDIVAGPGFCHAEEITGFIKSTDYKIVCYSSATNRISSHMLQADIAITSGGRTVFELAAVGTPTIVICQNERETKHTFATKENGIINLGLCHKVSSQDIYNTFTKLVEDSELRLKMQRKIKATDMRGGKARVIGEINALLTGVKN